MENNLRKPTRPAGVISKPTKPDRSMHEMMEAVLAEQSGVASNFMPVKFPRSRLLNVKVDGADSIDAIVMRNAKESPLLKLPAELRNRILALVVGGHHIYINSAPLTDESKPADRLEKAYLSYSIALSPDSDSFSGCFSKSAATTFYNYTHPLDWRSDYSTLRQAFFARLGFVQGDNLAIKEVETHYTPVFFVCRQLHHEIGLLPYSTNEFSFDSPETLVAWFNNRKPEQKRAMGPIGFNIEWGCHEEGLRITDMCMASMEPRDIRSTTIKVSRLALRVEIEQKWGRELGWANRLMRLLRDTEMSLAQRIPGVEFVD